MDASFMTEPFCKNCRFWGSIDGNDGWCRRYAPRPTLGGLEERDQSVAWPITDIMDWCGEWELEAPGQ